MNQSCPKLMPTWSGGTRESLLSPTSELASWLPCRDLTLGWRDVSAQERQYQLKSGKA